MFRNSQKTNKIVFKIYFVEKFWVVLKLKLVREAENVIATAFQMWKSETQEKEIRHQLESKWKPEQPLWDLVNVDRGTSEKSQLCLNCPDLTM